MAASKLSLLGHLRGWGSVQEGGGQESDAPEQQGLKTRTSRRLFQRAGRQQHALTPASPLSQSRLLHGWGDRGLGSGFRGAAVTQALTPISWGCLVYRPFLKSPTQSVPHWQLGSLTQTSRLHSYSLSARSLPRDHLQPPGSPGRLDLPGPGQPWDSATHSHLSAEQPAFHGGSEREEEGRKGGLYLSGGLEPGPTSTCLEPAPPAGGPRTQQG